MYHTFKDHQGSLAAAVHGNTVERLSHDPWGRRRNPAGFCYDNVSHTFDREYTLHEHYDDFGLVNMNGRMYDPFTASSLSADRFVQDPSSAQGFNRYAYCMHNPLRYVDPSGWRPRQPAPGSTLLKITSIPDAYLENSQVLVIMDLSSEENLAKNKGNRGHVVVLNTYSQSNNNNQIFFTMSFGDPSPERIMYNYKSNNLYNHPEGISSWLFYKFNITNYRRP